MRDDICRSKKSINMKGLFVSLIIMATAFATVEADDIMPMVNFTHGPWLQNVNETEATVAWTTDKLTVGWVEIALDDNSDFYAKERVRHYDTANGTRRIDTLHHVRIKGLRPGTSYRYRVMSQEVVSRSWNNVFYGRFAAMPVYNHKMPIIRTADIQCDSVSFVVLNDIHGDTALLADLMRQCADDEYSFVVFNGDMMTFFNDENSAMNGFMDMAIKLFATDKPIYYVRGNHETRGTSAVRFQDYFTPFQPKIYRTVRQGPAFLLMLDTGEDKPDSDIEYSGLADYDIYRTEQARWLAGVVNEDEYRDAPFKIVIAHIPPIVEGWHGNIEVAEKFMPMLNTARPDLMLCGHIHSFSYHESTAEHSFPILVNSNDTAIKVKIRKGRMSVTVVDRTGNIVKAIDFGN